MTTFPRRILQAARLNPGLYEEVEADPSATRQALSVVVLASLAEGIGTESTGIGQLAMGSVSALLAWFVWAVLTYFIGTRILPAPETRADVGELLRTTGFAAAPGVLRIAGGVPVVGSLLVVAADVWMLAAMVVAVRQALDYTSTWRAIGVCLAGWWFLVLVSLFGFVLGT